MKFLDKLKKDKNKGWKVILLFIGIILLISFISANKKEASVDVCNTYNHAYAYSCSDNTDCPMSWDCKDNYCVDPNAGLEKHITSETDYNACISDNTGCNIQYESNPKGLILGTGDTLIGMITHLFGLSPKSTTVELTCVPEVATGKFAIAKSDILANDICSSHNSIRDSNGPDGNGIYRCEPATDLSDSNYQSNACKSWQKSWANFYKSIDNNPKIGCSTQAWIVIGLLGFIAMIIFLIALR